MVGKGRTEKDEDVETHLQGQNDLKTIIQNISLWSRINALCLFCVAVELCHLAPRAPPLQKALILVFSHTQDASGFET